MDDLYRNIGELHPLKIEDADEAACQHLAVTELWLDKSRNQILPAVSRTIDASKLSEELDSISKTTQDGTQVLVLRLVWVDVTEKTRCKDLSKSKRRLLLDKFGLGLAYTYLPTCIAGVTAFPAEPSSQETVRAYSLSYAPKLGALWSYTSFDKNLHREPLTQGIIFTETKDESLQKQPPPPPQPPQTQMQAEKMAKTKKQYHPKTLLQTYLQCRWDVELCKNSQFPTFLIAVILGLQIDQVKEVIRQKLDRLEKGTNHHQFEKAPGADDSPKKTEHVEWVVKSEEASGHASKLASASRKGKMVDRLLNFMLKEMDEEVIATGLIAPGARLLRRHVAALRERLANQKDDMEYTIKRCQIQIEAVCFPLLAS
jgi:hypothetical protein